MAQLTTAKNSDYAGTDDAFKNFRLVEELKLCPVSVGILTRMSDKFARICNILSRNPMVAGESVQDTLRDLAVYAIILKIYLDDRKGVIEDAVFSHRDNLRPLQGQMVDISQKEMEILKGRDRR